MYKITQKNSKNCVLKFLLKEVLPAFRCYFYFVLLVTGKVVLSSESLFRPANGMGSTPSLVEIHNNQQSILFHISTLKCVLLKTVLAFVVSNKKLICLPDLKPCEKIEEIHTVF